MATKLTSLLRTKPISHSQTFLSARIKLYERHLLEWDTLAINQQKVWVLVLEENAKKLSDSDAKLLSADLKSRQAMRLRKIMVGQREKREQLRLSHQQEKALFAQVVKAHE